ncbi:unnamed protein product [Macrosiphum euphorbiae]|uniref:DUF4536 domain-containing protein n=1 Tax=Macrosiphum euphorbiae TaxID=13131 RepID=A0AAV0Y1Z3_9HEMI|nr:unnamed protein product [Macrosiphum euphorbiae]
MKAGAADHMVQGKDNGCSSCRVTGTVTLLMVAAYSYFGCKHVKPVYYFGTPSMIYLAVARALDLTPFNG